MLYATRSMVSAVTTCMMVYLVLAQFNNRVTVWIPDTAVITGSAEDTREDADDPDGAAKNGAEMMSHTSRDLEL